MVVAGTCANLLMGSFAHLIARTEDHQIENRRLFGELQAAYRQVKASASQAEALAAATERHHLVRELHDSLTQTLFSMNLAVQSAQLAVDENPAQVEEHLVRLQSLARSAAGEVQTLTGQVPYRTFGENELPAALQKLAEERLAQDGLQVTIESNGERTLPPTVQSNLYRIAQEALNNVSRHAGVRQAVIRLYQENPVSRLEIVDEGCGFDMTETRQRSGFGLSGMLTRASEIGWDLEIKSQPGHGTRISVEEKVV
jgi:signal transduction histidine kinase